jgi:hypothetical protein
MKNNTTMKQSYQKPETKQLLIRTNRMLLASQPTMRAVQTGTESTTNIQYGGTETENPVAYSRWEKYWEYEEEDE